ncbi:signal transduction histidine kinase [Actinoplanes octamycinicus]|uniref:histidine kinase n=1 Tax=Actinoplanes octamycinicus TaxID=135948 RepID=A0A7W7GQV2_9ACTN|nr:histidine kinase [Actinoplanes octamycinicus]MBB4736633.1 signal transduction histidine kinase [Actinoplanes octamycinicus]
MNFIYLAAAATLAGIPAGLAMTGGNAQNVMTVSLAVMLAGLVLLARRRPRTALLLSVLIVAGWRSSELIGSGWVWPATAALVVTVLAGHPRTAVAVAVIFLWYGAAWDWAVDRHSTDWVFAHLGGEGLWLTAALAGTVAYRNTTRWRAELDQRRSAQAHVEIARDLHDVVSHTLAVVGVHLNVAMDAFDDDPAEARASLKLAQEVRGRAMTDLHALVGVLRGGEVPGLGGLARLVEQVRAAGLPVSLNEFGDPVEVPAPVAIAVYRVVQEALTNTVKHAGATRAVVTVRYASDGVLVDVRDDGSGAEPAADGHGISGMRERVAALGGALTAGPTTRGFSVRASLPLLKG